MGLATLFAFFYNAPIVRYGIIGLSILVSLLFRKKIGNIINTVKEIKIKKNENFE